MCWYFITHTVCILGYLILQDLLYSVAEGGCTDIVIKLLDDVKMNVNMLDVVSQYVHGLYLSIYFPSNHVNVINYCEIYFFKIINSWILT